MNSPDRLGSLFLIKKELEQWVSHAPEDYVQLHGMKSANVALQKVKMLIDDELRSQVMGELSASYTQSLGLYNLE